MHKSSGQQHELLQHQENDKRQRINSHCKKELKSWIRCVTVCTRIKVIQRLCKRETEGHVYRSFLLNRLFIPSGFLLWNEKLIYICLYSFFSSNCEITCETQGNGSNVILRYLFTLLFFSLKTQRYELVTSQSYSNMETQSNLCASFSCFALTVKSIPHFLSRAKCSVWRAYEVNPPLMRPISCLLLFCPLLHARLFFSFLFFSSPLHNQNTC